MKVESESLYGAFKIFGNRFIEVAGENPDAELSGCPGWGMEDLVKHVGMVYGTVEGIISRNSTERPPGIFASSPNGDVLNWAQNNFHKLLEAMNGRDINQPIWTWGKEQNIGFYIRRMTHESLVHMWDAETVAGEHISVDGDIACDGVDEYIGGALQFSADPTKEFHYPTGSIHFHRTDGVGEWLLEAADNQLVVKREHAKGDAAVRGSALHLLLYLWGRESEDLEIFGDPDLVRSWGSLAP